MDKKECIKFILSNSEHLTEIDKLNLLYNMRRRKIKINECSDGARIWLDRLPRNELLGITEYIKKVIKRDSNYFISI